MTDSSSPFIKGNMELGISFHKDFDQKVAEVTRSLVVGYCSIKGHEQHLVSAGLLLSMAYACWRLLVTRVRNLTSVFIPNNVSAIPAEVRVTGSMRSFQVAGIAFGSTKA
jgi:hypothetical protein